MKRTDWVLWGLVVLLAGLAVAVSCADSENSCSVESCNSECAVSGQTGECRGGDCFCVNIPPADADADITPDVREDGTTPDVDVPPDVTPEGEATDVRPEDVRPEDVRPEDIRPEIRDEGGTTEGGESGGESGSETGEAKSAAPCDPLACFMTCGGTCDPDGRCACP